MGVLENNLTLGVVDGEDAVQSTSNLEAKLFALDEHLNELPADAPVLDRAFLELEKSRNLTALDRGDQAWPLARAVFDVYLQEKDWDKAVQACEIMFMSEQDGSLSALGHGVWLSVSFPVETELSLAMLQHIVDETPNDADGAAVAAATGVYLVELRAREDEKENLIFFANQLLGTVGRRHSNVESQEDFTAWIAKLELDDPQKFLIRLRNVVDVLVQDDWWVDRDALRADMPEN